MAESKKFLSPEMGHKLREIRKQKGLKSPHALAKLMQDRYSYSGILRRETGKLRIDNEYINIFCQAVGVNGEEKAQLLWEAHTALLASQQCTDQIEQQYWEKREKAQLMQTYSAGLIPKILQTPDYTRAVIETYHDIVPDVFFPKRLKEIQDRRNSTTQKTELVCSETALYTPVGNPQIMIAQLQCLKEFHCPKNVQFHILPISVFLKIPHYALFSIFDRRYAICETRIRAVTSKDKETAQRLTKDFAEIWEASVGTPQSHKLIQQAITHYQSTNSMQ